MRTKQPTLEEIIVLEEALAVLAEESPEIINEILPALAARLGGALVSQGARRLAAQGAKSLATQGAKSLATQGTKTVTTQTAKQFIKKAAQKIIASAKEELMNMAKEQAVTLVKNKILEKTPESMKGLVSKILESPVIATAFQEEIHNKSTPGVEPPISQGTSSAQDAARPTIAEGSTEEKTIIIEEILNALNEAHCNSAHGRDTAILPMGGPLAAAIAPIPPVGSPIGGCGDGGDQWVSKTHKEYDDAHMLKKSLEILANQAMTLHDAIAGGMTLPSWAEAKVYCATDDIKEVHASLDRGRVSSGPQTSVIQLAESFNQEEANRIKRKLNHEFNQPALQEVIKEMAKFKIRSPYADVSDKSLMKAIYNVTRDIDKGHRPVKSLATIGDFHSRSREEGVRASDLSKFIGTKVKFAMENYIRRNFPREETSRKELAEELETSAVMAIVNYLDDNTLDPQKFRNKEALAKTIGLPSIERGKSVNK